MSTTSKPAAGDDTQLWTRDNPRAAGAASPRGAQPPPPQASAEVEDLRLAIADAMAARRAALAARLGEDVCTCGHAHGQHELRSTGLLGCYITGCLCTDFESAS